MKPSKFKMAALASAALMCAAAGSAHAGAYALSSLNIQNFTVTGAGPGTNVTFTSRTDTSGASASMNGVNVGGPGVVGSDAPIAVLGTTVPVVSNNSQFAGNVNTPIGPTLTNYSYADALITHLAAPNDNVFHAQTIAESHLATSGNTAGTSTNSSASGFRVDVIVGPGGGSLDFDFTADPLIRTFLQPDSGKFAQGTLSASLTISCAIASCGVDANGVAIGLGDVVFGWQPNGKLDGVTGSIGGTEAEDDENLNLSVTNDITATGGGPLNFSDGPGLQDFHAFTNALNVGRYTLTLAMTSTDATIKAVPEPGTIGLLGLGLAGLAMTSRRRKA